MSDLDRLRAAINAAQHLVALTGAGVSTLSGIRDFRGKNGLYQEAKWERLFDLDYFDTNPEFYYENSAGLVYDLDDKQPSLVHRSLAALERQGKLKALITQNIDLLHQKAGSKNVIEAHGSPAIHYCRRCGEATKSAMAYAEICALVRDKKLPRCPRCGAVLKPAITFFGENLPENALRAAQTHAEHADLLLVLGTSLTVYPLAAVPQITLRRGGKIVIVNDAATTLDAAAWMKFADLAAVFSQLDRLDNG
ncbi:NAD-dependent protein deacetylase [Planctomycetales bacterium]|nr:NAD-dependent protein deacetylase [Planctomycetales bacterium]GHT00223.1 NAD-dependent protein deacetylase [Planctomycetales bacterium]